MGGVIVFLLIINLFIYLLIIIIIIISANVLESHYLKSSRHIEKDISDNVSVSIQNSPKHAECFSLHSVENLVIEITLQALTSMAKRSVEPPFIIYWTVVICPGIC